MARARNIKPSLFKNEILGVADPLLTILFGSLWCLADRDGRLEDRPLRIKAETFPYRENLDINGYLTELSRLGFIRRYLVAGIAYIQVVNFTKHQTPHHTEKASEIPKEEEQKQHGERITVITTLKDAEIPQAKRSDSLLLIPDSPVLIPESAPAKLNGKSRERPIPKDFAVSDRVKAWAAEKNFDSLEQHLENFRLQCEAKGYQYIDWDSAFMKAISKDWAGVRGPAPPDYAAALAHLPGD